MRRRSAHPTTGKPLTRFPHRYRPQPFQIFVAFEDAWTEELERAWAAERIPGDKRILPPRMVAEQAAADFYDQWHSEVGAEYASEMGLPPEQIVSDFGRAPDPDNDAEALKPPTLEEMVEWLGTGWLLRWWRYEIDEGEQS